MSSSAPLVKAALVAELATLFPAPILTTYGRPGPYLPDEIVAVLGPKTTLELGAMSPARRRKETVETPVLFSVFRPGDEKQQQVATERAYAMCDQLIEWLRTGANVSLGGACMEAHPTEHELAESTVTHPDDPSQVMGALSELALTVTSIAYV